MLEVQVIDHGIEHCEYFQGCGTAFTKFTNVQTGHGCDFQEAFEDVIEQIAMDDMREELVANIEMKALDSLGKLKIEDLPTSPTTCGDENTEDDGMYYYVSIRWKE